MVSILSQSCRTDGNYAACSPANTTAKTSNNTNARTDADADSAIKTDATIIQPGYFWLTFSPVMCRLGLRFTPPDWPGTALSSIGFEFVNL